ncbi:Lysophospholipase, alpha-beta hydrolase superfamily [Kandleria vitulina]|uniref:Lysophospholipase, alpha-beta hydrolase superfamily n=1 Tax=Kandleria vitulina TaxID=1630 RepID=A0A1H2RKB8_9FIRM|nr:alpha/beta fold hydrolase [Kandleria vitulina]SDW19089.1 Lysophospholipase, alpha-beta hydrolase superfamily [Kandleria vitulina]
MIKNEFYFQSSDHLHLIHAIEWIPSEVKAVLQIAHGMIDHIDRYDRLATYLCQRGIYVVGNDHLGHGLSVLDESEWGSFPNTKGYEYVVEDLHKLRTSIKKKYPDVPYFMMGHSMGSFLMRLYIARHKEGLAGCVLMGTGLTPSALLSTGKRLCQSMALVKGWQYRSAQVETLSFKNYNSHIAYPATKHDWLSNNEEEVMKYENDPMTSYTFTLNGYYNLFSLIQLIQKKKTIKQIPKTLPILLISGANDPVGQYGKGVTALYMIYRQAGFKDVKMKLYRHGRHEIFNDLEHEESDEDIYIWLCKHIS